MIDPDAPINAWMPIVWYGGYQLGLPDLCVGRWPAGIAVETPWKLWAVETPGERDALLAVLARPVPRRAAMALWISHQGRTPRYIYRAAAARSWRSTSLPH